MWEQIVVLMKEPYLEPLMDEKNTDFFTVVGFSVVILFYPQYLSVFKLLRHT